MSEILAARVGRIISGGLNAMVDAVENAAPELVMEEAIREVDSAIDEVRAELGKVIASKHLANTRLMDENRRHEELSEQIRIAVEEGRDDLAEAGIARQLDVEAQIPILERSINDAGDQEKELEGYVNALLGRKREMREELVRFRESRQNVAAEGGGSSADNGSSVDRTVSKAQSAFDRVMENSTGLPGMSKVGVSDGAKLAELEELSRNNRVRERLARLKAGQDGN